MIQICAAYHRVACERLDIRAKGSEGKTGHPPTAPPAHSLPLWDSLQGSAFPHSCPLHPSFQSLLGAYRFQEALLALLVSWEHHFLLHFHVHLGDYLVHVPLLSWMLSLRDGEGVPTWCRCTLSGQPGTWEGPKKTWKTSVINAHGRGSFLAGPQLPSPSPLPPRLGELLQVISLHQTHQHSLRPRGHVQTPLCPGPSSRGSEQVSALGPAFCPEQDVSGHPLPEHICKQAWMASPFPRSGAFLGPSCGDFSTCPTWAWTLPLGARPPG